MWRFSSELQSFGTSTCFFSKIDVHIYLVISHMFYIQKSYRKCPVEVCHQTTSLQHQLGSDPVSKYTSCKVVMSVEKDKRTEYIPKGMLFSTHSPSLVYAARWFSKKHRRFWELSAAIRPCNPSGKPVAIQKNHGPLSQVFRGSSWQNNGCLMSPKMDGEEFRLIFLSTEKKITQIIWGLLLVGDDVWSGATRRFAGGTTARDCAEVWPPWQGRLGRIDGLV